MAGWLAGWLAVFALLRQLVHVRLYACTIHTHVYVPTYKKVCLFYRVFCFNLALFTVFFFIFFIILLLYNVSSYRIVLYCIFLLLRFGKQLGPKRAQLLVKAKCPNKSPKPSHSEHEIFLECMHTCACVCVTAKVGLISSVLYLSLALNLLSFGFSCSVSQFNRQATNKTLVN